MTEVKRRLLVDKFRTLRLGAEGNSVSAGSNPAVGVDVGERVIVRYDEKGREVVGLTLIGVGKRMEEHISKSS